MVPVADVAAEVRGPASRVQRASRFPSSGAAATICAFVRPKAVGYHVFWKFPRLTLRGKAIFSSQRIGPIADGGKPLVIPAIMARDFLQESPMPPGEWFLEPVDDRGLPVSEDPLTVRVPRAPGKVDAIEVLADIVARLDTQIDADPALAGVKAGFGRSESAVLARVLGDRFFDLLMTPPTPGERESIVADLVERLLAEIRAISVARAGTFARVALCRSSISALLGDPLACSDDQIRVALDRGDYEDAAARVLARFSFHTPELPVSFALVAQVLPGIRAIPILIGVMGLALRAEADINAHRLAEAIDPDVFPETPEGAERAVYALFCAWQHTPEERRYPALLVPLRLLVLAELGPEATAIRSYLMRDALRSPHAWALTGWIPTDPPMSSDAARTLEGLTRMPVEALVGYLPERPERSPGLERRRASTALPSPNSRNALCPCGSGKKIKRCCGDRFAVDPEAAHADDGWEAWLSAHATELSEAELRSLTIGDLMRLPRARLDVVALRAIDRRLREVRRFDLAAEILDELATRSAFHEDVDEWRSDLMFEALIVGQLGVVDTQKDKLPEEMREEMRGRVPGTVQIAPIVLRASELLQVKDVRAGKYPLVELCFVLLPAFEYHDGRALVKIARIFMSMPSHVHYLGLTFSRAALLHELSIADRDQLLRANRRSRARALLLPDDEVVARWTEIESAAAEAGRIRDELATTSMRVSELRLALDARTVQLEAALRDRERVGSAPLGPDEEERRILRAKVEQLKAIISDGILERDELRELLVQAERGEMSPSDPDTAMDEGTEEPLDGDPVVVPHRRVLLLRFERAAKVAFERVPSHVAAEAMRTLGALAARDSSAWRGVKTVKGGSRFLLSRVGIRHRLILDIDGDDLVALDLVAREGLLPALKHLRG